MSPVKRSANTHAAGRGNVDGKGEGDVALQVRGQIEHGGFNGEGLRVHGCGSGGAATSYILSLTRTTQYIYHPSIPW